MSIGSKKKNLATLACLMVIFAFNLRGTAATSLMQYLFHSLNVWCGYAGATWIVGSVYDGLTPLNGITVDLGNYPYVVYDHTTTVANGSYTFVLSLEGQGARTGTYDVWVSGIYAPLSDQVRFVINGLPASDPSSCWAARADFNSKYLAFFPLINR